MTRTVLRQDAGGDVATSCFWCREQAMPQKESSCT
jgi:hypothetical protein